METYEIYGKHTFFPMGINAVCLIVLLILLAALYKELSRNINERTGGETYHVTAKFDVSEQDKGLSLLLLASS